MSNQESRHNNETEKGENEKRIPEVREIPAPAPAAELRTSEVPNPLQQAQFPLLSESARQDQPNLSPENLTEYSHDTSTRKPLVWVGRVLKTIITSPDTVSSIGNTIVSLSNWTGIVLHPLCGAWSLINQLRQKYFTKSPAHSKAVQESDEPSYKKLAAKILLSPGIYRLSLSCAFGLNALESLSNGEYFKAIAFGLITIANAGAARIQNFGYWDKNRAKTLFERSLSRGWSMVPGRIQSIIANPAFSWCAADLMIGVMGIDPTKLYSTPMLVSYGLAIAGVGCSVMPSFFRGGFREPSPSSLALNSATNYSFAVCNFFFGSKANAISLTLWGISSMILAIKSHHNAKSRRES